MATDRQQLFPGRTFISTVLDSLETKTTLSGEQTRRYLQRAMMAGLLVGVFYVGYFEIEAAFNAVPIGTTTLLPIGRVLAALLFGWALVFIYYTRSELLTSNMMVVSVGAYHKRIGWLRAMKLLAWCYVGNLAGGIVIGLLLKFSTLPSDPARELMYEAVDHKLSYVTTGMSGWSDMFVRAILCNLMINLAMLLVYNGLIKDDLTKSLAMITAVFIFCFNGFEHSVANTVLFVIVGFQHGINLLDALANVVVVLLGNFIGGGLLIGLYYAYVNDTRTYNAAHPELGEDD